jgi:hypothetical protein
MRIFNILFFVFATITSNAYGTSLHGYDDVIKEIVDVAQPQQRMAFSRCVEQWVNFQEKIASFESLLAASEEENNIPILKLEIGDTGYGSYHFVLIDSQRTRSSFRKASMQTPKTILKQYAMLRMDDHRDFIATDSEYIRDGRCYFLTVRKGTVERGAVVYGVLGNSKVGKLIKTMLEAVR